jgi:hypothetical protein
MTVPRRPFLYLVSLALLAALASGGSAAAQAPDLSPRALWKAFQADNPFAGYVVERDEIVPSDTVPGMKLRRLEVKFYSQTIEGRRWGHPAVVFMPADRRVFLSGGRRGQVVIVGQRSWDNLATGPWRDAYLGNYGEPIASRTGRPTMVCPVPGEYDGEGGREISLGAIDDLRKRTGSPADHNYFRLAVPYLRALDVMAGLLRIPPREIRAVIGGHSKRATSAYTAAAADPERVAGVVYMGNESEWDAMRESAWKAVCPAVSQDAVKARVLYIGGTNEDGYRMFGINRIQEMMRGAWTIAYVPNYRHSSMSEHHFLNWPMWIAHVFDGRPLTRISDLSRREAPEGTAWGGRPMPAGTIFRARIASPNKIIMAKVWYVYCDDVPYWRDLVWYPEFMVKTGPDTYEGYVTGRLPDAWLVEVKDTAGGFAGYLTSLPQDITGLPTAVRTSRGSRSRLWSPIEKKGPSPSAGKDKRFGVTADGGEAPVEPVMAGAIGRARSKVEPGLYGPIWTQVQAQPSSRAVILNRPSRNGAKSQ